MEKLGIFQTCDKVSMGISSIFLLKMGEYSVKSVNVCAKNFEL